MFITIMINISIVVINYFLMIIIILVYVLVDCFHFGIFLFMYTIITILLLCLTCFRIMMISFIRFIIHTHEFCRITNEFQTIYTLTFIYFFVTHLLDSLLFFAIICWSFNYLFFILIGYF